MLLRSIVVNGEECQIDYLSLANLPTLDGGGEGSNTDLDIDYNVSEGSRNPVSSGAVYDAIQYVYSDLDNVSNSMASDLQDLNTQMTAKLNTKVDAVSGKGLSTNDFTANYKRILDRSVEGLLPLANDQVPGRIPIVVRYGEGVGAYNVWQYMPITSIIPSADDEEF